MTPPKKRIGRPPGSKDKKPRNPNPVKMPVFKTTSDIPLEFMDEVMETAKRLPDAGRMVEYRKPRECAMALWMLAQNPSMMAAADATGLDWGTIRRLCRRHADTLETKRKEFAADFAMAARSYTELLMERADQLNDDRSQLASISPDKLALTVGIMTDKSAQLSGMPGVIHEHRKGASIDDAVAAIAEARARIAAKLKNQAIEAEVIE